MKIVSNLSIPIHISNIRLQNIYDMISNLLRMECCLKYPVSDAEFGYRGDMKKSINQKFGIKYI